MNDDSPGAASRSRLRSLALLAIVPTMVDVVLLVVFRQSFGWPLIVADTSSIALASTTSFVLHRRSALRHSPYSRWVRTPNAFLLVAVVAGAIDVAVLRLAFTTTGFTTTAGLVAAKAIAITVSVVIRLIGYRSILGELVHRDRPTQPGPPVHGRNRFTVVVPAYREAERIGSTVRAIAQELQDIAADGGLEIIVVDDGSGDATPDAALDAGADQVIVLPQNRGKGGAVRAGMVASTGRTVAFTDADLAYDPPHLRRLLEAIESGWDVAIGNRRLPESVVARANGLRRIGSSIVNRLSGAVLLAAPTDTQCGLKGFRGDVARDLFRRTHVDGFAFDIEVLHLTEREQLSLTEIPVTLDETGASSTVNIARDVVRLVIDMVRIRIRSTRGGYDRAAIDHPVT
ncbi:glycosyltransferase [Actinospongicola halichondriae]|uniref:glycosyltransferase n=1 Tax=Actinospongicola halichondriae TaxID=3236844 RepID=UPI003D3A6CFD